jgi:hypothetical protein
MAVSPNPIAVDIPIETDSGFIVVTLKLNGQGPYRFLLDTGTQGSWASSDVIKGIELQAKKTHEHQIETNHQVQNVTDESYVIENVQLGDYQLSKVLMMHSDALDKKGGILKTLHCDGLLGIEFFQNVVLMIDVPHKRLHLDEVPLKNGIPFSHNNGLPIISTKITPNEQPQKDASQKTSPDNSIKVNFILDTGYTGYIKMPFCLKHDGKTTGEPTQITDIFQSSEPSALGEFMGTIALSGRVLTNPQVLFPVENCEKPRPWGLIGLRFFEQNIVSIDQAHLQVTISPAS